MMQNIILSTDLPTDTVWPFDKLDFSVFRPQDNLVMSRAVTEVMVCMKQLKRILIEKSKLDKCLICV